MEREGRVDSQQISNDAEVPGSKGSAAAAAAAAGGGDMAADGEKAEEQVYMRRAEEYMPIANILRIMRRILPPQAKVADDAKETMQECLTEFISYITCEANVRCHRECRKTVTAEDIIAAMSELGFDDYVQPLTIFLQNHRAQDPQRVMPNRLGGGGGSGSGGSSAGAEFGHFH